MRRPQFRQCRQGLIRQSWMKQGRNAPARDRRDRLRALPLRQFLGAPASQQETGDAGLLRCQLQAARGVERQHADLSDDRAQGPAPQGFFQRPAHFRIAPGRDQDQPAQIKAEGGEAGRVKIGILRYPDDPSRCRIGLQRQREKSGSRRALFLIAGMAGNFVDGTERNDGIVQISIDRSQTGGQRRSRRALIRPQSRDAGDALSQLGQVDPSIHGSGSRTMCSLFVLNRPDCQAAPNSLE